ncbi:MAG TPA: YggS family pyridoxal phosphate-dependent enzyme [Ilumatobacter sp.]|nr:YggS family pyridoxal phosphate-dependent enzyme [Ilumatobacter sp.]
MTSGKQVQFDDASVAAALAVVRERISAAGGGSEVSLLPVTKSFPVAAIAAVQAAGYHAVGENYVQEVVSKSDALAGVALHFIGQLQTNKVRQLAGRVAVYETVDRVRLIDEIARRDPGARVLLQVDTSGETGKGGCPLAGVDDLLESALAAGLVVDGLMTVGPTGGGPDAERSGFRAVRAAMERLGLRVCSMGMTADLEVAVAEGSTQVRVGTALFGPRVVRTIT